MFRTNASILVGVSLLHSGYHASNSETNPLTCAYRISPNQKGRVQPFRGIDGRVMHDSLFQMQIGGQFAIQFLCVTKQHANV